ncbi:hypothetical protein [Sandaracinus amylolyticus]|uniref:Uncharacterized protein n=1 Tax=Sandaracinus amylolyticus TaxID=927083 RepID=A0A0F6SGM9_9BACT|nr:hypothetical protein [Sandaracinus amylolyticus]AKF08974.1 hypothetical protein DB32_006123 [Sandaracinus amylolyticus]
MLRVVEGRELVGERGEGDRDVRDDRLHRRVRLEDLVEIDGVEDAEDLLADLVAAARRTAEHLVVEDASLRAPHEDDAGDRRDVDAGGEETDGDRDVWEPLVLEAADELERTVGGAGDLHDRGVRDLAVGRGLADRVECLVGVGAERAAITQAAEQIDLLLLARCVDADSGRGLAREDLAEDAHLRNRRDRVDGVERLRLRREQDECLFVLRQEGEVRRWRCTPRHDSRTTRLHE